MSIIAFFIPSTESTFLLSQAIIESEFLNDGFLQAILAAELLCFLFIP